MLRSRLILLILLALTLAIPALPAQPKSQPTEITGQAHVIDGDTIAIRNHRIRIHGIDAPETRQSCADAQQRPYPCGSIATKVLSTIIAHHPVHCVIRDKDRYGRSIAQCFAAGADIGAMQVRLGMAVACRRYSEAYVSERIKVRLPSNNTAAHPPGSSTHPRPANRSHPR